MQFSDITKGYDNAGGWRFKDKKSSNDFLTNIYRPEAYNGGLLDSVGNPNRGALDKALAEKPIDNIIKTGLLQDTSGSGGSYDGGGVKSNAPSEVSDVLGFSGFDKGMAKSALGFGPIAAGLAGILGGMTSTPTLSQAAIDRENQTMAQRAAIAQAPAQESGVAAGGGWSSLSADTQAAIADSPDPIGAFADAIGMGGGGTTSGGDYGGFGGDMGDTGVGGVGGNSGGTDNGTDNSSYAKGGMVKGRGTGTSDSNRINASKGEFVVKASSVKKYGKGLLSDINNGTFKR